MTNYYVKTSGNDGNDGLSVENAFTTINKAISKAEHKDIIYIASGTYREILLFNKVNIPNSKIKIIGDEGSEIFTDNPKGEIVLDGAPNGITPVLECAMRFETNNVGQYDIRNIKVRRYLSKVVFHDNTPNGIIQGRTKSGAFIRKTATVGCSFVFHNCEFSGGKTGSNDTGQPDTATYSLGCFVLSLNGEKLIFNKCTIEGNNFENNTTGLTFASVLYTFGNGLAQVDFKKCSIKNNTGRTYKPTSSTGAGVYNFLFTGNVNGHIGLGFHMDNIYPSALTMYDSVVEISQIGRSFIPNYFKIAGSMCDNAGISGVSLNTNKFEIVRTKIKSVAGSHYMFSGTGDLRVLDSNIISDLIGLYVFFPTLRNDSSYEFINSSVVAQYTIFYISVYNISGQFTKSFFTCPTSVSMFDTSNSAVQCSLTFCDCYFSGGNYQHSLYAGSSSSSQTANFNYSNCIFDNSSLYAIGNIGSQRLNISNSILINNVNTMNTNPSGNYADLYMNRRVGNTTQTYGANHNGVDNSIRPTNPAEIPAVIFQEIENPIEGMLSPKVPIAPIGRGTIQVLLEGDKNYEIRLNAKKTYAGETTKMQFWIDSMIVNGADTTDMQEIIIPLSPSYSGFYDLDIFGDNGVIAFKANATATYDSITIDNVQIVEV